MLEYKKARFLTNPYCVIDFLCPCNEYLQRGSALPKSRGTRTKHLKQLDVCFYSIYMQVPNAEESA